MAKNNEEEEIMKREIEEIEREDSKQDSLVYLWHNSLLDKKNSLSKCSCSASTLEAEEFYNQAMVFSFYEITHKRLVERNSS